MKDTFFPTDQHIESFINKFESGNLKNIKLIMRLAYSLKNLTDIVEGNMKRFGLTKSKFNILMILLHNRESKGVPLSEIARGLFVNKSTITGIIDGLTKLELIERVVPDSGDRRQVLAKISDKGVKLLSEVFPSHTSLINSIFDIYSDEEKDQFLLLTDKLVDKFSNIE